MLGIFLMIEDILCNWYVLETNLMVFVFLSHLVVIFGNLPVVCLTEGISLVELSGFSSHLESEISRLESGNSGLEPALLHMGKGFCENSVTVYWVAIGILFVIDFMCTLAMIGPQD